MSRIAPRVLAVTTVMVFLELAGTRPAPVHAQPSGASGSAKTRTAKDYVKAGLAAQNTGDYGTAIELYRKAYELVPHHILLFNIGQAHRLAGRLDEAFDFYTRYLAADPQGVKAAITGELLAELTARKLERDRKAEEARKVEAARRVEAARTAEAARKIEEARRMEKAREAAEARRAEAEAQERASRTIRHWGLAIGGAGMAGAAASIAFGRRASRISDELSRTGAVYDPAKEQAGRTANRYAISIGVASVALIAGGAITYWSGHRRRVRERIAWTPILSKDLGGVALTGVLP